jgi:hypothetical protein
MSSRPLRLGVASALVASVVLVGSASAAEVIHDPVSIYFPDEYDTAVCGFTVVGHKVGIINVVDATTANGPMLVETVTNFHTFWENPENGRAIEFREAGVSRTTADSFTFSGLHDLWTAKGSGALIVRAFRIHATEDGFTLTGVERFALSFEELDALFCSLLA